MEKETPQELIIEEYVIRHMDESSEKISIDLSKQLNKIIEVDEIDKVKDKIKNGKALVNKISNAVKDALEVEIDKDVLDLSDHFSIATINKEFEIIYDRIKSLYELAKLNPDEDSYDKRISSYLERANALRNMIIKDFFSDLKKNIMLDVGKRIILSAISTFLPYIPDEYKHEAKDKFMISISNILSSDIKTVGKEDEKIKEIKEKYGKAKKKEQ